MHTGLYQLFIQSLDNKPDLSIVQEKQPIPESWPLLLDQIQVARKKDPFFTVSDGQVSVICQSTLPEVYTQVASIELGSIIHLQGAQPVYNDDKKSYTLDVQGILTLKDYNDLLKAQEQQERDRIEALRAQEFRETFWQEPLP